ncbi:3'-5' exonuclease [Legionella sp. W05-934-2]|jgi:predicted PolB exonuclease-like 3'-5' exonuclease|uniref:3'-5' exonuclease n=1 Tax=Legionella sp. W05-934-2 TaxID=1198649 RepID=UPI003462F191
MTVLVFDIETIPDVESGRRLYQLDGLTDYEVSEALFKLRREKTGNDFLPHHLQKVVAISLVLAQHEKVKVWSLGEEGSSEKELLERFFQGIDRFKPMLLSWNGSGFDLPVMHYRSLLHSVAAPSYWELGEHDRDYKFNNYINRYHYRHLDLMDMIAGYNNRAFAPLDEIATMLGFPGKMGMSGSKVWEQYQAGNLKAIRDYCETDVLNTYLVYLRFQLMRGELNQEDYQRCLSSLTAYLQEDTQRQHLIEFAKFIE